MTTILMVTSLSRRALDQESLVVAWLKKGYRVIVLNFFDTNPFKIPGEVNYNFISFKARSGMFSLLKIISKVISLCWRNKVDCMIAHLEYPSFVSVIASFFTATRVVVYRHHADFAILNGLDKRLSYKFTYRFAPVVVVVSNHAKRVMIDKEKVRADKIKVVRLAFDFNQLGKPSQEEVQRVKNKYNATVLLLAVGL
jgi:hypothetical protein